MTGRRREQGYSLVALMAAVAIMLVLMAAATPTWRFLAKNDREEELLFRGGEIADAIQRYQRKNGNALPASLDVLIKGRFLRRAYKDPMTKHGNWRYLRAGDLVVGPGTGLPGARGGLGSLGATTTTTTTTMRSAEFSSSTVILGGFIGVATTHSDTSFRMLNGRTRYEEWLFVAGQPRVIGKPAGPAGAGQVGGPIGPIRPGTGGAVPGGAVPGGALLQPHLAPPPPPP